MKVRAGLLLLLPVIALAIYIEGQRYDPEIFDFSKTSGNALAKYFPSSSGNLTRKGPARVFTKENLYEYINGHAEFFISSGFNSLAVAGYGMKGEEADTPAYTVDIFDMGSPGGALGVISQEAKGLKTFEDGFIGYKSRKSVMFIKGPYYVKLNLFSGDRNALYALAKEISDGMGEIKTELPQFVMFPEPGAIKGSDGYVSRNYMGLDFMANVFTYQYKRSDKEFSAFLVVPKNKERFLERMLSFYDETGTRVDSFSVDGANGWEINDKYDGAWSMAQIGSEFIGVSGLAKSEERLAFLKEAVAKYRIK